MAKIREESIAFKAVAGVNSGLFYVELPDPSERLVRAGKVLALCWGLAVAAVFIPIVHFVLVPLFLIAGPVMAYQKYRVTILALRADGCCPECQQQVSIALDSGDRIPKRTYCPACNKPLQLVYDATLDLAVKGEE